MPPIVVLLVNVGESLTLLILGSSWWWSSRTLSRSWALVAALPLVNAGILAAFVFGEDSYRDNGISRWDAYRSPGSALGPLFTVSVALMAVSACVLALAALRGNRLLFRALARLATLTALFLLTPTIIGFSSN